MVGNIRSDLLLRDIELSRCIALVAALANAVDLVVHRCTVVVSILTGASNSPLDVRRMPCTDTSNLPQTLMRLSWQLLRTPSAGNTLEAVALGDSDAVDHFILLKDGVDLHWLLEEAVSEVDLVGDAATVDLDLHEVGLLLLERSGADLSVGEDTDNRAVLPDALKLTGDRGALVLRVLLGVLGEGLLLRLVPVLIKAALELVTQVLSPNSGERSETAGSLNVANKTNNDHLMSIISCCGQESWTAYESYWWGLNNGGSLDDLLLVHLRTWTVKISHNCRHTGLVAHGGCEVDALLRVILGEAARR